MNTLGISLVWCIVQVTLFATAAALCYAVARRFSAAAGSLTALSALVGVVCLTALAFVPLPRWSLVGEPRPSGTGPSAKSGDSSTMPSQTRGASVAAADDRDAAPLVSDDVVWSKQQQSDIRTQATTLWNSVINVLTTPATAAPQTARQWPLILGTLLAGLVTIGVVRLLIGLVVVRSYYRRSLPVSAPHIVGVLDVVQAALSCRKPIELRESSEVATPATIGWRKPIIFLPPDWTAWSEQECHAVLAHEVAHIQRNDFLAWVCAQTGLALHFYHPLVHWLAGRLRLEQELAADAAAASVAGGQRCYLMTLAEMALRQSERPLAWPARTFLPTRGTFLRRIEMLRDNTVLHSALSAGMRLTLVSAVVVAGLFATGLRGPETIGGNAALADAQQTDAATNDARQPAQAAQNVQAAGSQDPKEPLSTAWVPRDAIFVAAIRPARLLGVPLMAPLRTKLNEAQESLFKEIGVTPDRVSQVTVFVLAKQDAPEGRPSPDHPALIVRLEAAKDADALLKAFAPDAEEREYGGRKYVQSQSKPDRLVFRVDERTLVIGSSEAHLRRAILAGASSSAKSTWFKDWQSVELADAAVLVNIEPIRGSLTQELGRGPALPGPLMSLAPLVSGANTVTLAVQAGKQLSFRAGVAASSAENAQNVKDTVSAVITLAKNAASQGRAQASRIPDAKESALMLGALEIVEDLLNSVKIDLQDTRVSATAQVESEEAQRLVSLLTPAITDARSAARRAQSMNNLKQIGLALHNYHDVNKSFPPAVLYGPDGKTPYSWRLAILPYLEQDALFRQYNFNEPWDSENNKKVLAKMPAVYRDPSDSENSTNASYFALTGPMTVFSGKEGTGVMKILDGTSNTIMVVEALRDIPWTKPEDIPYAADKPVPKLGGRHPDVFLAALCDGSVRAISQKTNEKVLRGLFTKDGGEQVFDPVPAAAAPRR